MPVFFLFLCVCVSYLLYGGMVSLFLSLILRGITVFLSWRDFFVSSISVQSLPVLISSLLTPHDIFPQNISCRGLLLSFCLRKFLPVYDYV